MRDRRSPALLVVCAGALVILLTSLLLVRRLTQPLERLEGSRSRRTGGSGLGLAIARQLCDAHGWSIRLLPRTGGGLEARLDIPLANDPGPAGGP